MIIPALQSDSPGCSLHPDQVAVGTCTRCGTFVCAVDQAQVDGVRYCEACSKRPDVDWLEAFRLQQWGKRDGWAWLIGLGTLANVAVAVLGVTQRDALLVGQGAFAAVVSFCFWLGKPWARYGMLATSVFSLLAIAARGGDPAVMGDAFGKALGPIFVVTYVVVADTRNKLFFKIDVSREKLHKLWNTHANNSLARAGFFLGLVGLLLPLLGPIGLICSIIALRRVDPTARPPIGRKGQAIAGIVLGGLGMTLWLALFIVSAIGAFHR